MKLWSILRKPNRLDEIAAGDARSRPTLWNNVRLQIRVLHLLAQSYMVFITAVVCFTSTHLSLPFIYQDSETKLLVLKFLMYYLCGSGLINFVCVTLYSKKSHFGPEFSGGLPTRSTKRMLESDWSEVQNGASLADNGYHSFYWQKCNHCEIKVPPRARHCSICQTCILKRDHHCFFTACCIGFYNQRFFIAMAFFGMTAGLWGTYNFATYLNSNYASFLSLSLYRYFLPYCFISATLGYMSVSEFLTILLFYIQLTSSCGAGYYFWWQMFITYYGQTSVEALKRIKQYDKGPAHNFRSTLGTAGFLSVILPIPFILSEGDGKSWELNQKVS